MCIHVNSITRLYRESNTLYDNCTLFFFSDYHGSSLCLLIIEACTWFCRAGIPGNLKPVVDIAAIFRFGFFLLWNCLNSRVARHPKVNHLFYSAISKLTTVSNGLCIYLSYTLLSVKYHDQLIAQLHVGRPSEFISDRNLQSCRYMAVT